jgi:predicted enzyme related to lactoylglutathione lyase
VDDIEQTVRALRARGVEVSEVKMGGDQSWQAWLADPDGNRIELHQYTPESWQAPFLR